MAAKAELTKPVCMNRSARRRVSERGLNRKGGEHHWSRELQQNVLLTRERRQIQNMRFITEAARKDLHAYKLLSLMRKGWGRAGGLGQFRGVLRHKRKAGLWLRVGGQWPRHYLQGWSCVHFWKTFLASSVQESQEGKDSRERVDSYPWDPGDRNETESRQRGQRWGAQLSALNE